MIHKGEDMSREHAPLNLVGGAEQRICDPFVDGVALNRAYGGRSTCTHSVY